MKKSLLFTIAALMSLSVFGQGVNQSQSHEAFSYRALPYITGSSSSSVGARTTSTATDTGIIMLNFSDTASALGYGYGSNVDSGYASGMNFLGSEGAAERYWFTSTDTTIKIIGVKALFVGTAQHTSTKWITFSANTVSAPLVARTTLSYSGAPSTVVGGTDTVSVRLNSIPLDTAFTTAYFATPAAPITTAFFIGFGMVYNWHALAFDTVGLASTRLGARTSPEWYISGGDTTINDQCVRIDTQGTSNVLTDMWYNAGAQFDWFLFPIVDMTFSTTGVGIASKNLTFFGTYPNPASNNTNVKFSLNTNSDVVIDLSDMSGRTINTMRESNLSAGEHIVPIETSNLPSGNYLCTVHSLMGGGVSCKITVAH